MIMTQNIPATFRNEWPDRTKRAWDCLLEALQKFGDDAAGYWIAIRLSDGGSDGVIYPSKQHAVAKQIHERQCAYICIHPFNEMSISDIHRYLRINEQIYDQGGRLEHDGTHVVPAGLPGTRGIHT